MTRRLLEALFHGCHHIVVRMYLHVVLTILIPFLSTRFTASISLGHGVSFALVGEAGSGVTIL